MSCPPLPKKNHGVTALIAPANDFRKVSFSSPEKADRRWLDWYREEYARLLSRLEFEVDDENELRVQTTVRALPGVAVCYGGLSPMRIRYDPHRAVDDDILLVLPPAEGMSIELRNSRIMLHGHGGAIAANDVPNIVTFGPASNFMSVLLSRRLLAPLVPHLSNVVGKAIPTDSQPLRLFRSYVRSLDDVDAITTPEARHLAATHLRDLAALAIGATRDGAAEAQGGARAARLASVKADIVANVTSRDVTIAKVAARQGVTPRYIGALFAAEGTTFTDFVLEHRLAHAHRRLSDPRFSRPAISTIAYDSGFGDLSYFNQAFRRRYGVRPSDVRADYRLAS
jgi:AraC-like DNA-binding protein